MFDDVNPGKRGRVVCSRSGVNWVWMDECSDDTDYFVVF